MGMARLIRKTLAFFHTHTLDRKPTGHAAQEPGAPAADVEHPLAITYPCIPDQLVELGFAGWVLEREVPLNHRHEVEVHRFVTSHRGDHSMPRRNYAAVRRNDA